MSENDEFSGGAQTHATEGDEATAPTRRSLVAEAFSRFIHWTRETTFVIVMALALSVLLRTFVFQAFYVPSSSMEQTLLIV